MKIFNKNTSVDKDKLVKFWKSSSASRLLDHEDPKKTSPQLASCLIYAKPVGHPFRAFMWVRSVSRCYRPWNSRKIRCSLFLFSVKKC